MRSDGFRHGWISIIRKVELLTGFLNDFTDGRIMYMTDAWKKVVLHLVIQATHVPVNKPVIGSKIRSCFYLVRCPLVFNKFRIYACCFKFCVFNNVRKLKNECKG